MVEKERVSVYTFNMTARDSDYQRPIMALAKTPGCLSLAVFFVFVTGCATVDSDGDGVRDRRDACFRTPSNASVDEVGCAVDNDHDRVVDYMDDCPGSAKNVTVNKRGCAPDNDNDGVSEGRDLCEGTPAGVEVDATGCEVVEVGINIVDPPEQSLNIPVVSQSALSGGEVVVPGHESMKHHVVSPGETLYSISFGYGLDYKQVAEENNIQAPYNIHIDQEILIAGLKPGDSVISSDMEGTLNRKDGNLILSLSGGSFALGSTDLTPDARSELDTVIVTLKKSPYTNVLLNGYTDHLGDAEYNQRFSEGRANSVKNYLVSQGIVSERLQARGYGEIAPASSTDSVEALARNRRVDIIVK